MYLFLFYSTQTMCSVLNNVQTLAVPWFNEMHKSSLSYLITVCYILLKL